MSMEQCLETLEVQYYPIFQVSFLVTSSGERPPLLPSSINTSI